MDVRKVFITFKRHRETPNSSHHTRCSKNFCLDGLGRTLTQQDLSSLKTPSSLHSAAKRGFGRDDKSGIRE